MRRRLDGSAVLLMFFAFVLIFILVFASILIFVSVIVTVIIAVGRNRFFGLTQSRLLSRLRCGGSPGDLVSGQAERSPLT